MNNTIGKTIDLISIIGPTAVGKTALAARLAARINGEIISADSRQVYRGMNLGTGKDYADYLVEGRAIPYHLIDVVDAGYKYSVFEYQTDFLRVYSDIHARKKMPILCGGTGMYVEAVVSGYRLLKVPFNETLRAELETKSNVELNTLLSSLKKLHNRSDSDTRKRLIRAIEIETYQKDHQTEVEDYPKIRNIYFGVAVDRETRRRRITERLHARLKQGMIEEVQSLIDSGVPVDTLLFYGLEYKLIAKHLIGELTYDEMVKELNAAIHQFAKRQMTWFRKMEREGNSIIWIDGLFPMEQKLSIMMQHLEQLP
ncbi:MAG TPA: tRNA (adenosine(37)-N6)-dimethylallyltransferase MiaA [Williamwhitmania sp.]|nr:tRNA (adenosine(37)-N6)-dimethylallyltransferase MiaA [Williamwhitmania sp.]